MWRIGTTPRANSCVQLAHNGGLMDENDSYLKKGFGFLWGIKWLQTFTDQLWSLSPQDANRQQHSGGGAARGSWVGAMDGQHSSTARVRRQLSSTKTRIEHVKKRVKLQLQGKFHTLPSSSSSFGHGQSSQSIVHQRCTAELRIETTKVSCLREHCNDSVTLMTQLELQFAKA